LSKRWPEKIIVGLTGNIATGKSTVLQLAQEQDALTLDADAIVHEILATDPGAQQTIVDAFGPSIRQQDGSIDRAAMATIVFTDENSLSLLEQILHPRVRHRLFIQIDRCPQDVVFIEAIKLLEGGLSAECDQIWVTRCPIATQIERLMAYRDLDEETALMRVNAQSSQDIKAAVADIIIDTGGSLDETRAYFDLAWNRLQRQLSAGEAPAESLDPGRNSRSELDVERIDDFLPDEELSPVESSRPAGMRNYENYGEGIVVRRAQPADIPTIIELVGQASQGAIALEHDQLITELGERGYLIGQQGDQISAIAGWNADNLVATIEFIYVQPPEAIPVTGAALLHEIEVTANELICEVILHLSGENVADEIRQILKGRGFRYVDPESLPRVWQAAVTGAQQPVTTVMMKVLRDTRQVRVRTIKEHHG
jgi:dephospho-CoA kinase